MMKTHNLVPKVGKMRYEVKSVSFQILKTNDISEIALKYILKLFLFLL